MSNIVKIQTKGQVVIPRRLREQVGVSSSGLNTANITKDLLNPIIHNLQS